MNFIFFFSILVLKFVLYLFIKLQYCSLILFSIFWKFIKYTDKYYVFWTVLFIVVVVWKFFWFNMKFHKFYIFIYYYFLFIFNQFSNIILLINSFHKMWNLKKKIFSYFFYLTKFSIIENILLLIYYTLKNYIS